VSFAGMWDEVELVVAAAAADMAEAPTSRTA